MPSAKTHAATVLVRSVAIASSIALTSSSCGGTTDAPRPVAALTTDVRTSPAVAPRASVSAHASASAAPSAAADDPAAPYAWWTDPEATDELAKDCAWQPDPPNEQDVEEYGAIPVSCVRLAGQVCQPDACAQSDESCLPECSRGCGTCSTTCVASCETCKAACNPKDAACHSTCAKGCGACHAKCLVELDQCSTGHCSDVFNTCVKAERAEWAAADCAVTCPKVEACASKCKAYGPSPCQDACVAKYMKGKCPSRWQFVCLGMAQSPDAFGPAP